MPPMMEDGVQVAAVATTVTVFLVVICLACGRPETRGKVLSGDGHFHFDRLRFEHIHSDTRGLGTMRFGLLRLAFGVFATGSTLWRAFGWPDLTFLATFTCWSWFLLGVYFVVVGLLSVLKACYGPDQSSADNRSNIVHKFLWVWCQIMTTMAIFICLICWFVLIPLTVATAGWDIMVERYFDWVSFSAHNVNVVFMFIELYLNRVVFLKSHAPFIALYGNIYIVFSWFYYWEMGMFFYEFLDWDLLGWFTPLSYIALLAVLYATFLGVARCTVMLKRGVPEEEFPVVEGTLTEPANQELTLTDS